MRANSNNAGQDWRGAPNIYCSVHGAVPLPKVAVTETTGRRTNPKADEWCRQGLLSRSSSRVVDHGCRQPKRGPLAVPPAPGCLSDRSCAVALCACAQCPRAYSGHCCKAFIITAMTDLATLASRVPAASLPIWAGHCLLPSWPGSFSLGSVASSFLNRLRRRRMVVAVAAEETLLGRTYRHGAMAPYK